MSVVQNFKTIQSDINNTFDEFFIPQHPLNIVAISKRHTIETIRPLLAYGHCIFGENHIQEASEKWASLRHEFKNIQLHMVGHIQSNKLMQACDIFDVIETMDSKKLIDGLIKYREQYGKIPKIFIQVNTGCETQKYGVSPDGLTDLVGYARENNIDIDGLMCIPPKDDLPVYHFTMLKNLAKQHHIKKTSMGMSADYKNALICKTDYVRIGTGIFGQRDQ